MKTYLYDSIWLLADYYRIRNSTVLKIANKKLFNIEYPTNKLVQVL